MRIIAGTRKDSISFPIRPARGLNSFFASMTNICGAVKSDPDRAKLLNIRYTGLEAYSTMEGYERMKAGMRLYRRLSDPGPHEFDNIAKLYAEISPLYQDPAQVKQMLANDIAFYMGWVGHYAGDAAMPLHDSIHHDGWAGDNPKGYTRDPKIHDRFEEDLRNLIGATEADILKYVSEDSALSGRPLAGDVKALSRLP